MAIDFPASPTVGQEYTSGGMIYVYNGTGWTIKGGSTTDFVKKAGDTMTGDLIIQKATPTVALKDVAGSGNYIQGQKNGIVRWNLAIGDSNAETGSNAGSDIDLFRFNDVGVGISSPFKISRATGITTLEELVVKRQASASGVAIGDDTGLATNAQCGMRSLAFTDGSIYLDYKTFTGGGINFRCGAGAQAGYTKNFMRVDAATGNVGIQQATASNSSITGALTVAGGLGVGGSINAAGYVSASAYLTSFNSSVGYGIGLTTNNASIVGGPISFANSASAQVGSVSYTAGQTGVAYNTSSGAELKEDLKSFDAGSIIDNTNVYDFAWKSTKERAFGVIAQQAVDVYPQAVTHQEASTERGSERDEWWGVDYSKYVPVLLQELKALRARVAELEGRTPAEKPITTPKKR